MAKTRKMRGGDGSGGHATSAGGVSNVLDAITKKVGGGRRRRHRSHARGRTARRSHARGHSRRARSHKRRSHRRRRGGNVLRTAAVPFGLFGLKRLFQQRRTRKEVRSVGKKLRKPLRTLSRSL